MSLTPHHRIPSILTSGGGLQIMENREYHNIKINRGEPHVHLRRFSAKPTPTREAYAKPTQMHMCFSSYISLQLIPALQTLTGREWIGLTGQECPISMLETFALLPGFRWDISVRRDKNAFRHKICPKLYTAGFSGQNFNTAKFT